MCHKYYLIVNIMHILSDITYNIFHIIRNVPIATHIVNVILTRKIISFPHIGLKTYNSLIILNCEILSELIITFWQW